MPKGHFIDKQPILRFIAFNIIFIFIYYKRLIKQNLKSIIDQEKGYSIPYSISNLYSKLGHSCKSEFIPITLLFYIINLIYYTSKAFCYFSKQNVNLCLVSIMPLLFFSSI